MLVATPLHTFALTQTRCFHSHKTECVYDLCCRIELRCTTVMAKNRRRQYRARRRARRSAELVYRSHDRYLQKMVLDEEGKAKMKEYESYVAGIERDLLSRMIYVTNVRDLNDASNLSRLQQFLEEIYWSVEKCWVVPPRVGGATPAQSPIPPHSYGFIVRKMRGRSFKAKTCWRSRADHDPFSRGHEG